MEGSGSAGTVEPGLPLGPAGAGGSTVTRGVPAVDRWMGGDGSVAAPEVLMEGGSSDAMPHELMEGDGSIAVPHEPMEGSGPVAAPHEPMEGSSPVAAPSETREASPPASEQGAGSKRSRPHELEQGPGVRPRNVPATRKCQSMSPIPLVFPFIFLFRSYAFFLFCRFLR